MNAEEKFTKAEQEVEKAIQKLADAKRKANDLKRTEENKRKFFIGGLFAKYLREELNLELLALSKEETTRVIALAMKHRDIKEFTSRLISDRNVAQQNTTEDEESFDEKPDKKFNNLTG